MASIRKRKAGGWIVEVRIKRINFYKSKIFDDKLDAINWAAETEHQISINPGALYKTLADAIEIYAKKISVHKKCHRTESKYFIKWSNHDYINTYKTVGEFNVHDLQFYIMSK